MAPTTGNKLDTVLNLIIIIFWYVIYVLNPGQNPTLTKPHQTKPHQTKPHPDKTPSDKTPP